MSNVLSDDKRQQVIALGRLGWSLRGIEQATGVRRETASAYIKAAGISVRPPGWKRAAKPAIEVTTDSDPIRHDNSADNQPEVAKPAPIFDRTIGGHHRTGTLVTHDLTAYRRAGIRPRFKEHDPFVHRQLWSYQGDLKSVCREVFRSYWSQEPAHCGLALWLAGSIHSYVGTVLGMGHCRQRAAWHKSGLMLVHNRDHEDRSRGTEAAGICNGT